VLTGPVWVSPVRKRRKLVPDPINKAAADAMPGAVWHPVEGGGHFVAVGSGDDIFAIAARELGAA
jgi:pimeloyl-ACP methyl ester carboxylesterase